MSTTTTNYNLVKPELTDAADITAMNLNWDTIDTKLKTLETADSTVATNLSSHTTNKSNPHGVTKAQVGLGNVDNTSDANKPISSATQTALNNLQGQIDAKPSSTDLATKVDKSGDTLTGVLVFQNTNGYGAIEKYRTINGVERHIDFGVGNVGGNGCVALQYMEGSSNTVLGRLEIGRSGVSFYDENGKRTYLYRNDVVAATVE